MQESEFRTALDALKQLAAASDNRLTQDQIRTAFEGQALSPEHEALVAEYLRGQGIRLEGPEAPAGTGPGKPKRRARQARAADTGEDSRYYRMYLQEMEAIRPLSEAEWSLLELGLGDDEALKARVAEAFLPDVARLAGTRTGRGVLLPDLIQEGNTALWVSLQDTEGLPAGRALREYLLGEAEKAMMELIALQEEHMSAGERMAQRSNHLLELSDRLTEELGRAPEIGELARAMGLPEDEIRDIMQVSLNAVNVLELSSTEEE